MEPLDLETALAAVESQTDRALQAASEITKAVRHAKSAAATGKLADMEKSIAQARQQLGILQERMSMLEDSWTFDSARYFESGSYSRELIAAVEKEEMKAVERDGRVLCYPSVLRILPAEQSLEIDRKKQRGVRPSFVARELKKHRNKSAGMKPERLLEVLYNTYEVLVQGQKGTRVVRLSEIHDLLTQLPQAKDYSKAEFARDLVQLDMSDVRVTRSGKRLALRADTAVRSGAPFFAVTPEGEVRVYSGVEFKG